MPRASIVGLIKAKDGTLLSRVLIQVKSLAPNVTFTASTYSANGRFRIENVPEGYDYSLETLKEGYRPSQTQTTTTPGVAGELRPVNITLNPR